MKHYKVKVKKTVGGSRVVELKSRYGSNYFVTVQAVYYGCTNPSSYLHLFEGVGDAFLHNRVEHVRLNRQQRHGEVILQINGNGRLAAHPFD